MGDLGRTGALAAYPIVGHLKSRLNGFDIFDCVKFHYEAISIAYLIVKFQTGRTDCGFNIANLDQLPERSFKDTVLGQGSKEAKEEFIGVPLLIRMTKPIFQQPHGHLVVEWSVFRFQPPKNLAKSFHSRLELSLWVRLT